jgi:rhamnose transport system ATP-binding protein
MRESNEETLAPERRKPLLQVQQVDKSFPGVHALDHVSLDIWSGEIHAIVGENGAGKSTLMQIIAGVYRPDSGTLVLDGKPVVFANRHEAEQHGISIVYQELSLVPNLSVAENIYAGRQPSNAAGFVRWPALYRQAQDLLDLFKLGLDARTPVRELSLASRQIVEIAKALSLNARLLLLDEPTSALSRQETETLFALLRRLRDRGIAIVYISHHLEEVFAIAERITVLRDGRLVQSVPTHQTDEQQVVSWMVGHTLEATERRLAGERREQAAAPLLEVRHLTRAGEFQDISFVLRRGEILGIGGLAGAGRSELAQSLYGFRRPERGEILLSGRRVRLLRPADAIRQGIAYLSADRKELGLFLRMTLAQNIAAPNLKRLSRLGLVRDRLARLLARDYMRRLSIRASDPETVVNNLSGGNQQKVLLAAWLATAPRVLIIDEPTRGIDVGAKAEIHLLLRRLAENGVAILMITSDLPELLTLSDRLLVMARGRLVAELSREEADEEKIMTCAAGVTSSGRQ